MGTISVTDLIVFGAILMVGTVSIGIAEIWLTLGSRRSRVEHARLLAAMQIMEQAQEEQRKNAQLAEQRKARAEQAARRADLARIRAQGLQNLAEKPRIVKD